MDGMDRDDRPFHGERRYSNYSNEKQQDDDDNNLSGAGSSTSIIRDPNGDVIMEEINDVPLPDDVYEVDSILARKIENGRELYAVKWTGWTKETWEPIENLRGCEEKLRDFNELLRGTNLDKDHQSKGKYRTPAMIASVWERYPGLEEMFTRAYSESKGFDLKSYEVMVLKQHKKKIEKSEGGPEIEKVSFVDISTIKSKSYRDLV
ncbi:hypothetical protein G9A89_004245 [Geosiphon pyriformis]|nr:hypothetical protein G9A89_004245 [Geosiphon pyriformis]